MKEIKYQGKYISVTEEDINNHVYERVEVKEGVQVFPYKEGKILLIKELRTHEKQARWKFVSGMCDKEGKTPLEHAQEELAEEASMIAESWEEIYSSSVPFATINPNVHFFVCTDVRELSVSIENPDTSIVIEKRWFTFEELFQLMNTKEIWLDDVLMVAVWYLYTNRV